MGNERWGEKKFVREVQTFCPCGEKKKKGSKYCNTCKDRRQVEHAAKTARKRRDARRGNRSEDRA